MKTKKFNLQNWTGEEVSVNYSKKGKFEFYGYTFQLGDFIKFPEDTAKLTKTEGYRILSVYCERELTTIFLEKDDMEQAVIQAVRYVANNF